jgi:hypothetical protein
MLYGIESVHILCHPRFYLIVQNIALLLFD